MTGADERSRYIYASLRTDFTSTLVDVNARVMVRTRAVTGGTEAVGSDGRRFARIRTRVVPASSS